MLEAEAATVAKAEKRKADEAGREPITAEQKEEWRKIRGRLDAKLAEGTDKGTADSTRGAK